MGNRKHIVCLSGGEASALAAVEVFRVYGSLNMILLNHNINRSKESADIKRFKNDVANYIGLPITYANIQGIFDDTKIPNQFDVCIEAGALTNRSGQALCTSRLKTEPFINFLNNYFSTKNCTIYYGFDLHENLRIQRRTGIMGALGYETDYPMLWKKRTITSISEIGIEKPSTYSVFEHANCIGCLKASLLHWYVVYCVDYETYCEGKDMEFEIEFTIHTVIRNGVKMPISLADLEPIFQQMQVDGIPATEHQSKIKFAQKIRKYQLEESKTSKPCECMN